MPPPYSSWTAVALLEVNSNSSRIQVDVVGHDIADVGAGKVRE